MSAFETVKNVQVSLSSMRAPGWRKTWSRRAAVWAFAGCGATSFGGCGSVAGPEYTGEVGLELRGEVVFFDGAGNDRVPVLAFIGQDEVYLVDGDITGEFPSQFAFRVDEAPPAGALRDVEDAPNDADVAVAFLVMASKDHPATMKFEDVFWSSTTVDDAGDPDPETGVFTRTTTTCSDDGERCQTKSYSCEPEACETLLVAEGLAAAPISSGYQCIGDACLTHSQSCEADACTTTIAICEDRHPDDVISSDGTIDRCTLESTEGPMPPIGSIYQMFAEDLLVYFSTADIAKDDVELKQGYSVVHVARPEKNDWAEDQLCRLEARDEVYRNAGDESYEELDERAFEAEEKCPELLRWEVVDNPSERELTISLGEPRLELP